MTTATRRAPADVRLRAVGTVELVAGLWLLVAPFVLDYPRYYPELRAVLVDLLVGALVASLATLHLLQWPADRWASAVDLCLGLFLVAAPAVFGYTTDPRTSHAGPNDLITGGVIVLGAVLSLVATSGRRR